MSKLETIYLTLDKCGGGDGSGDHSKQRFTYTYKDGSGRITYDHPTGLVNSLTIDMGGGDGRPGRASSSGRSARCEATKRSACRPRPKKRGSPWRLSRRPRPRCLNK